MLARRVSAEGRTRAYLGGRSATAADLQEVGGALLSFYGQHEHRKLTLASAQLAILDGFCGPEQAERRAAFAAAYARERELRATMDELKARAGARDRELDLLEWELQEIEAAAPTEEEEASLATERERLRHLEALIGAAGSGVAALGGDDDSAGGDGAAAALSGAARALEAVRGVDPELDALGDRVAALAVEADDVAADLRRYAEGVEAAPRPARGGRGAARAAGPAEAQARRHARRRPRARRELPPSPRRARRRRGGARGGRGRAGRGRARSWLSAPAACAPPGAKRPPASPRRPRAAHGAGDGRRHVRGRAQRRARATAPPAATTSSS